MELNEQITALQSEAAMYKNYCEIANAEKIALDQMLVETLKNSLEAKKNVILKDEIIRKLNIEISVLKEEKIVLQKEIDALKSKPTEEEVSELAA